MKRLLYICGLAAGTLLVTACGGSSGGGSEETASGVNLLIDNNNYASKTIRISDETDIEAIDRLYLDLYENFILVDDLREAIDLQSYNAPSNGNCPDGGTAILSQEGDDGNIKDIWTFTDCILTLAEWGAVRVNGVYQNGSVDIEETETSYSNHGYEIFDLSGILQDKDETFDFKGRLDDDRSFFEENGSSRFRLIDQIDALELRVGDRYVALAGFETHVNFDDYGSNFTYSTQGTIIGSAIGGYVQVTTPAELSYSGDQGCPIEGVFRFSSNGNAEARFGSSANGTAPVMAIWLNDQLVASYDYCTAIGFTPI